MTGPRLRFASPGRRRGAEPMLPMINVVFLLLVFFLLLSRLAPADPADLALPATAGADQPAGGVSRLVIAADGALSLDGATGAAVWMLLAERRGEALDVAADARLGGAELAAVLARLQGLGAGPIRLRAVTP